ncbi:MAG: hypothetical protein WDM91_23225 [Rhizomicrobium sp.]
MEIIELPVQDEWPHKPGPEMLWQESVVLTWQDVTQSIGGFFRIGHQPNRALGICTFGIVSSGGRCFNRSRPNIPITASDRFQNGFQIDKFLRAEFEQGRSLWTAHDDDCDIALHVTDIHPQYDTWALSGLHNDFRAKFAASHTEVAGLVAGTVRLGDRDWKIKGFAYRDHSWGVRDHSDPAAALANLFWLVGSFGKDFVICACETVSRSAKRFNTGFVIKDGEIDRPVMRDISFNVELDGISTRGARCRIETEKFGAFDIDIDGFGNVLMGMQAEPGHEEEYLECGMPGRMRCNGMTGGVHLSTMFNARGASGPPALLFGASRQKGLYTAPKWSPSSR